MISNYVKGQGGRIRSSIVIINWRYSKRMERINTPLLRSKSRA